VDPADLRTAIAENIRLLAEERGLSLNQLVDLAGVGRSSFYRALSGESALTSDSIARLAEVLSVHPAALMLREGDTVERRPLRAVANPSRSRRRGKTRRPKKPT
jgi:transcriptional regulator with XRE-family HTH domain